MANLLFGNDSNLILDGMRLASDNSVINDAVLAAHFFDNSTSKAVTGATNATPIVITSNTHGYNNGDVVVIAHVLGNKAANGKWVVANKTANTFELTGSVGSGSYTRGGDIYTAITNGVDLSLVYQSGTNGRYIATIDAGINLLAGESARVIVFCSNYDFQMERDHSMQIRT